MIRQGPNGDAPFAFTPPRDDLAGAPRIVQTPRKSLLGIEDAERHVVNWQACAMSLKVLLGIGVLIALAIGTYNMATLIYGRHVDVDCLEQTIEHGVLAQGAENDTTTVRCDPGYIVDEHLARDIRAGALKCRLVSKACEITAEATTVFDTQYLCVKSYAYTTAGGQALAAAPEAGASKSQSKEKAEAEAASALAAARAVAQGVTQGLCTPDPKSRIGWEEQRAEQEEKEEQQDAEWERQSTSSNPQKKYSVLPKIDRQRGVRWSGISSTFALLSLLAVGIATTFGTAIVRGRQAMESSHNRHVDVWDCELLDDDDASVIPLVSVSSRRPAFERAEDCEAVPCNF